MIARQSVYAYAAKRLLSLWFAVIEPRLKIVGVSVVLELKSADETRIRLYVETCELRSHQYVEHAVDTRYDGWTAPIVFVEFYGKIPLLFFIAEKFADEYPRLCETEFVDTLLWIAHHKKIRTARYRFDYLLLHFVGVLILVDANIVVLFPDAVCDTLVWKYLHSVMLEVAEIEFVYFLLLSVVIDFEPFDELHKFYNGWRVSFVFLLHNGKRSWEYFLSRVYERLISVSCSYVIAFLHVVALTWKSLVFDVHILYFFKIGDIQRRLDLWNIVIHRFYAWIISAVRRIIPKIRIRLFYCVESIHQFSMQTVSDDPHGFCLF